jgi:GNAT superfamily N-acetyltransferase
MNTPIEIVSVDAENLTTRGFFCRKSKMKTTGNLRKLAWAADGFDHDLGIEIVYDEGRSVGFVEYVPGEHTWRAVSAPEYLVVHCIWVVGRAKDKGYGSALLERTEAKGRELGCAGVAAVTSSGVWLAGNNLFLAHGYEQVDEAPPSFQLMIKPFRTAPEPKFPTDWAKRAEAFGDGLTIVTTNQCPYLDDAERAVTDASANLGVPTRMVKLEDAGAAQARSPSAFGVFGIVFNGELLSYHYLLEKDLVALLSNRE